MSRFRLSRLLLVSTLLSLFILPLAHASDADNCVQQQLVFNPKSGGFMPVNNFNTTGELYELLWLAIVHRPELAGGPGAGRPMPAWRASRTEPSPSRNSACPPPPDSP